MPSKAKTSSTVTQTSGGKYQTFNNLNNIKKKDGNYAQAQVHGKKQPLNRPSTINCKNFSFGIPAGALATKITIKVKHQLAPLNGKNLKITAPTVSLLNNNTIRKYSDGKNMSKKGNEPTTTAKETKVTFNLNFNYSDINSSNFGVQINYPTNANDNEGYIRVYYVEVTVTYRTANFTLSIGQTSGEYNGDYYWMKVTCNNLGNVAYIPSVTINAPLGFSYYGAGPGSGLYDGDYGTITVVNPRTLIWKPKLGVDINSGSCTVIVGFESNVSYSSGQTSYSGTFNAVEDLQQHTASKTVTVIKDRPVDPTVDPPEPEPVPEVPTIDDEEAQPDNYEIVTIKNSQGFDFDLDLPSDIEEFALYCCTVTDGNFADYDLSELSSVIRTKKWNDSLQDYVWSFLTYDSIAFAIDDIRPFAPDISQLCIVTNGPYTLVITPRNSTEVLKVIYVDVMPSTVVMPSMEILKLSEEECHRLGPGHTYTVQDYFKLTTSEDYIRDWNKNFRIAVFNNAIQSNVTNVDIPTEEGYESITVDTTDYSNLTVSQIFENAEYWSDQITHMNQYDNLEVKFPYNKDYPVYILIVGESSNSSVTTSISFTEPVIAEDYQGRVPNGLYPKPINDLIAEDSTSNVSIEPLSKTDTVVFYDFPLREDFGTDENIVIRGLAVQGITDTNTDNLRLNTSLVNDKNESKQRSIILDEFQSKNYTDNEFTIGQVGDLWGFKTNDIQNLEDWEIHLLISNVINQFEGNANIGDVNLIVYYELLEAQNIKCYIEGEDLNYYGVFLRNVNIPEGLKTDTDYITVDGTDTNDPYRQNIKSKTIELEFDVGDNCDLEGATLSMRELARLLVNRRDQYNRPIPKRIEFSHYPDVYWEYIMEEPIDSDIEISSYSAKVKLVVPAGTSYDKVPTSTAETGFVSGLAAIHPTIQVMPTESLIAITEKESGQEFNMGYSGNWTGKIVEIDCDDRIVWLKESEDDVDPVNISQYVDFNSDWFVLNGEYEFQTVGCAIRTVDWQERW